MGQRLFIATRKGLFTVDDGAVSRVSFLGDPVTQVLADRRDGTLYAALNLGHFGRKLHRSRDGGASFEECGAPTFPAAPGETDDKGPSVDLIWALAAGATDEPGLLWAGTIPGGLFRSRDRGTSWELMRALWDRPERARWFGGGYDAPGIHSICVHPSDGARVTVGVSCGGVWATSDGGASWENRARGMFAAYMPGAQRDDPEIQDPHCVVQSPSAPEVLWAQHHNGIFRSTDGARSWSEVTTAAPSSFGFAVAVHPSRPDTAWFVPAVKDDCRLPVDGKLVVSRTRDGGRSFEVLRRGLPQEHAYDLCYRHALAVDESGDRLAFGSTSGGVWHSDDGGDSWRALPARLPPVYAVRFE